jgi:hypothetical protein
VSAYYKAIANATARTAPTRTGTFLKTVPAGALVEGVRIVTGELVSGVDQWASTPEGWFIHMGALEPAGRKAPLPGDALAYAEADVERLRFELTKATMIRDALRGLE